MNNNLSSLNTRLVEYGLVFLFFGLLGLYRFWPVLFNPYTALTNFGDGIGSMSGLAFLSDILKEKGLLSYIFNDSVVNGHIAAGLLPGGAYWSLFWRVVLLPLVLLNVEPQNIYDIWGLILFILTGVGGYYLARVLGARYVLAIFAGLIYVGMDNIGARLIGHITLVSPFMILIQIGLAISAARTRKTADIFLLAVASWLSFQVVEYYGYYSFYFSVLIFIGYLVVHSEDRPTTLLRDKKFMLDLAGAAGIFGVLMAISYPSLVLAKLGVAQSGNVMAQVMHDSSELLTYSVAHPLGLFMPSFLGNQVVAGNPGEFTFRIGLAIAVAIWSLGLVLIFAGKQSFVNQFRTMQWLKQVAVFFVAGVVLALIGLHPDYRVSLSRMAFDIAPMFRVVARSYLLVDISLISILIIIVANFLRVVRENEQLSKLRATAVILTTVLLLCVYADVTRGFIPSQFGAYPLSQKAHLFNGVPPDAAGKVIELPFWPPSMPPEKSYDYNYNWAQHKHPIVNGSFSFLSRTNRVASDQLESFASEVNHPDGQLVDRLGRAGIRYLVANCGGVDYSYIQAFPGLKLLSDDGCSRLYEVAAFDPRGSFIDLLKTYGAFGVPDPKVILSASDCRASIKGELLTEGVVHPNGELSFRVTLGNLGGKVWGDKGADVQLGAVWFNKGKIGASHDPNLGEKRIRLPSMLNPGASNNLVFSVNAPGKVGDYELWLSPVQPGVMWCFHVGDPPLKKEINVKP